MYNEAIEVVKMFKLKANIKRIYTYFLFLKNEKILIFRNRKYIILLGDYK